MGHLAIKTAEILRATTLPDGRVEDVAQHSFMLGLVAVPLAKEFYPYLDLGLVSQFSTVHDLVETETEGGDTSTLNIDDKGLADKKVREAEGLERFKVKYASVPYLLELLERYEEQTEPEARFVRVVDKFLPSLTHLENNGEMLRANGVITAEHVWVNSTPKTERLRNEYPEFSELLDVRTVLAERIATMLSQQKPAS
ncbi:hypothetical protein CYG49_01805 [Candidatus Saccharibacteria bacterium]|nr:MAG: hypothetical protein CYG49_01805 [Candidatus Saccharibacteria bacterium]